MNDTMILKDFGEVIKDDCQTAQKCLIHVCLKEQISQEELKGLAEYFRRKYSDYKYLFIFYWLPDMEVGTSAAWATTHYRPELEIIMMGVSGDVQTNLLARQARPGSIGRWYDSRAPTEHTIEICIEGGTEKEYLDFRDGSSGVNRLVRNSNRFAILSGQNSEYYMLNENGDLEVWDEDGIITTARKIVVHQ